MNTDQSKCKKKKNMYKITGGWEKRRNCRTGRNRRQSSCQRSRCQSKNANTKADGEKDWHVGNGWAITLCSACYRSGRYRSELIVKSKLDFCLTKNFPSNLQFPSGERLSTCSVIGEEGERLERRTRVSGSVYLLVWDFGAIRRGFGTKDWRSSQKSFVS